MYIDGGYFGFIICEHLMIFFHLLKLMPHFIHGNDYFKYLLGDQGYMGEECYHVQDRTIETCSKG